MKILHAVHNYPPEFRGGIERVVETLVAAQIRNGHEVVVLAGSEGSGPEPSLRREQHGGIPVLRLVRGPGFRDPVDPFRADLAAWVDRVLAEVRPDVLHLHHWFNLGGDLVRRAARRGLPTVVTLHDAYATCGLFFRLPDGATPCDLAQEPDSCAPCIGDRFGADAEELRFRLKMRTESFRAELAAAGAVTAPSSAHAAALAPHVPSTVRIRVVPPGSPPVAPVAQTPRNGPLRVLHFGNLCRVKGVEVLVRAVAAADPGGAGIRLTLAGSQVEPDLDTGPARLAGPYDAEGLRALAADADVAAFPSLARESYSLVVDEALRLGLPVLVTDRGAASERIGGRGLVLPAGDERAWATALARLARDPSETLAMRARPHLPLTTPDSHADAMLRIYAEARAKSVPAVDLETPLLDRLAHFEARIGDLLHVLASRKGHE